jgi:hypothetical protein
VMANLAGNEQQLQEGPACTTSSSSIESCSKHEGNLKNEQVRGTAPKQGVRAWNQTLEGTTHTQQNVSRRHFHVPPPSSHVQIPARRRESARATRPASRRRPQTPCSPQHISSTSFRSQTSGTTMLLPRSSPHHISTACRWRWSLITCADTSEAARIQPFQPLGLQTPP